MNFLADESIDRQIVDALRLNEFSVGYIAETDPGMSDDKVLNRANKETAILITADKDFGEIVFRMRQVTSGVLLVRLAGLPPRKKAEVVLSIIIKHSKELMNSFSVITSTGIRIRRQGAS